MKDFNIVIAHRGNPLGLWATIHSCEIELANSGFDYSYLLSINGEGEKPCLDLQQTLDYLGKAGKLGPIELSAEPLSPPTARQRATAHADGELLFFFDNHCLVAQDYFSRALRNFDAYPEMDMLHSTTKYYQGIQPCYHYKLALEKDFWTPTSYTEPQSSEEPYRIAVAGHGGFVVRRSVWQEVGGYWSGFTGYGGEECYFDLKMALVDKTNWLDPKLLHYHFAGDRGYKRHYTDEYYVNMMMCAHIIGGEDWLNRVYQNIRVGMKWKSDRSMFDLYMEAQERSVGHAAEIDSIRKRSLDEQLELFRQHNIAH